MKEIKWTSEKRKLSELKPAKYNPRKLSAKQEEDLTKSLERFSLADPIIINTNNTVIGGHQRLKILKSKNGTHEIDVRVPDRQLSEQEEKELNLRLNRNNGDWDLDLLKDFDEKILGEVGFTLEELDKIFIDKPQAEDDEVPEVQKTNIKTGDLFQLGQHRILCGDSTKKEDVAKLMNGKKADMILTDPPYSVNYGKDQKELQKKSGKYSKSRPITKILNDDMSVEECAEKIWKPAFKNLYDSAHDNCSIYMTMCQGGDQMMMMMKELWQIKHELIWVKNAPVFSMGRLDYDYQHEPILFGWKKKHNFYGQGKFLKSVWEIPKLNKSELHPTMKPIELIENALLNSSKRNELILDTFLGSGSTLIACEKTNRICYGMELEPLYIQVIIDRWQNYTNKKAVKIS